MHHKIFSINLSSVKKIHILPYSTRFTDGYSFVFNEDIEKNNDIAVTKRNSFTLHDVWMQRDINKIISYLHDKNITDIKIVSNMWVEFGKIKRNAIN